jgi:hypothetical protein
VLTVISGLALLRFHMGIPKTLALAAILGVFCKLVLPLI